MIEQYVLDELKKYKEENEQLKKENFDLKNKYVVMVNETPKRGELKPIDNIISILNENNIDPRRVVDEMGSNEIRDLILNLNLYKEKLPKKSNNGRESCDIIVKIGNKCYELEKYYGDYKLENQVSITWEDEVYYELVDKLYDEINSYLRKLKKESNDE